jgi:hypothetical protein
MVGCWVESEIKQQTLCIASRRQREEANMFMFEIKGLPIQNGLLNYIIIIIITQYNQVTSYRIAALWLLFQ